MFEKIKDLAELLDSSIRKLDSITSSIHQQQNNTFDAKNKLTTEANVKIKLLVEQLFLNKNIDEINTTSLKYFPHNTIQKDLKLGRETILNLVKSISKQEISVNESNLKLLDEEKKLQDMDKQMSQYNNDINKYTQHEQSLFKKLFEELKPTEEELTKKYSWLSKWNGRNKIISIYRDSLMEELSVESTKLQDKYNNFNSLKLNKDLIPYLEQTKNVNQSKEKSISEIRSYELLKHKKSELIKMTHEDNVLNLYKNIINLKTTKETNLLTIAKDLKMESIAFDIIEFKSKIKITDSLLVTLGNDETALSSFRANLNSARDNYKFRKAMRSYKGKNTNLKHKGLDSYEKIKTQMKKIESGQYSKNKWFDSGLIELENINIDRQLYKYDDLNSNLFNAFILTILLDSDIENLATFSLLSDCFQDSDISDNFEISGVDIDISIPNVDIGSIDIGSIDIGTIDVGNIGSDMSSGSFSSFD